MSDSEIGGEPAIISFCLFYSFYRSVGYIASHLGELCDGLLDD